MRCASYLQQPQLVNDTSFIKAADTIAKLLFTKTLILKVSIFYLSGESISLHLLRYSTIAVVNHSFMRCASYLQQPQLVNDTSFIKAADTLFHFLKRGTAPLFLKIRTKRSPLPFSFDILAGFDIEYTR